MDLPLVAAGPGASAEAPDEARDVEVKEAALRARLGALPGVIVAFSGGVDSTYLLDVATEVLADRCLAVTAVSASLARSERDDARRLAASIGARHEELATDEGQRPEYVANGADRCYHCKAALFDRIAPLTDRYGRGQYEVAVGTIVDDLGDHRPGQRAATERGVLTPLVDAGFTKADVRAASRARGLPTWDKPAMACLASRVAHGIDVTADRLGRIAAAEAWLRDRGFRQLRVRDHGDLARVEVPPVEVAALAELAGGLDAHLRQLGWRYVTIDAGGYRTGSMNPSTNPSTNPTRPS